MKTRIECLLFGHRWYGIDQRLEGNKSITRKMFIDNCDYCGLSKEEVGISKKEPSKGVARL